MNKEESNYNHVLNTFTNSVAPGELNSLKRITLSQNLNLNSCFRDNYYSSTSTDFQYIIPGEINNVVSLKLASIEIPNSWYLFSSKHKNNMFKIIITREKDSDSVDSKKSNNSHKHHISKFHKKPRNKFISSSPDNSNSDTDSDIVSDTDSDIDINHNPKTINSQYNIKESSKNPTYDIIIPDGNYDNETLQDYLNNTYFCDSGTDNYLKYIRFSIDNNNLKSKFEILKPNDCIVNFSLLFFEDTEDNMNDSGFMNTAGWVLGYRLPVYVNITNSIQSEGLYDGSGDKYIFFSLNDYQINNNNTNIIGFNKSTLGKNVLAKIPLINGKLSITFDDNGNPLTKIRKYNGPVNIRKIHVRIFDKYGNIIDLNNMDFSFTLELETLYENFNFR